ncbi:hypothetical protein PY257_03290 [Ramlibacter sp. H39-3-26]|jgi:hypothetical protein|uniref:hypothetical protein n=1 Tax=Curvibacter soli TaxID=3031331 RepID=UPI0023DB1CF2|nr:hypothetical protein [Ramlibacter sp. H39-3-26]MDF1484213.1 hypothetical protein [Ramlibacter sp. H39-3-26]
MEDRSPRLLAIAAHLARCAESGAWSDLREADAQLMQLSAAGAWQRHERPALLAAWRAHDHALQRCRDEAARLGTRLQDLATYKDGWMAYALEHDDGREDLG